jgi:lipopolysaccharide assembly outer membrane protein LptD (OstA)
MRFLNSTTLIALLGSSAIVGLVVWGLFWRIEEVKVEIPEEKAPVVSADVDLIGRRQGQQRWRLLAKEVKMQGGQQFFDQGAHGYFYGTSSKAKPEKETFFFDEQGQMEWEAGTARYDAALDELVLNTNVKVRDPKGSELVTHALKVSPEEAIEVLEAFTLTDKEMVLSGKTGSFLFQFALLTAETGQVVILPEGVSLPPQPPGLSVSIAHPDVTTITADRLKYDRNTQKAEGEGNLIIREKDLHISAPRGSYDRGSSESHLENGVKLVLSANTEATVITANTLRYNRLTQVAEGEGNLKIQDGSVEITAPRGIYDRQLAQSQLQGGVKLIETGSGDSSTLLADLSLAQANPSGEVESEPQSRTEPDPPDDEVTIVADELNYDRNTEVAQGKGNLELRQGETILRAPQGSYRRRESQSIMTDGVTLEEPLRELKSQRLEGNHKDKVFLFEGQVIYKQQPDPNADAADPSDLKQSATEVNAEKLIYNSRSKISEFTGQVQFIQKGRKALSQEARITPELVTLTGDVRIEQIEGDWLAQRIQDPDAQKDLDRPTLIFADRVEIDQATSDARFFGSVVIVQENRAAEGDNATYFDGKQTFELASETVPVLLCDRGDVGTALATIEGLPGRDALDVTCRGANQIRSQLITLDMANDTFSAAGQSMMQFRVTPEEAVSP